MRILYSHRTRSSDGQYVHIEALTRALRDLGHEVLICGPDGISDGAETRELSAGQQAKGGASQRKAWPFGLYEIAELGYSIPAWRQLMLAAKRFKPDIIYERYNLYFHAGMMAAKRLDLPLLLEVNAPLVEERKAHGSLKLGSLARWSEDHLWRGADAVLPVTNVLADMIAERGVSRENLHVVPNGVDDRTLQPGDGGAIRARYGLGDKLVLGFVGFVRDWHGVDRVLDWLATPAGAGAVLLLVGEGPAVPDLVAQADRLGLADRFIRAGTVQRGAVADHIAAFDIALQPAVTAYASPLKLQEYMAQGRAIIAPDAPNIKETVTDDQTALLVDPDNPKALHDALDRLYQDVALRERLGAAARAALLDQNRTWQANAARVVALAEGVQSRS